MPQSPMKPKPLSNTDLLIKAAEADDPVVKAIYEVGAALQHRLVRIANKLDSMAQKRRSRAPSGSKGSDRRLSG